MSIIQNTIEDIKGLKWNGFHSALEVQLSNTSYLKMSFEERLTHLVKNEVTERRNRKIRQLTSRSKLKYKQAFIEKTDYRPSRNLDKSLLLTLIQNEWIERSQNIIISGATGTGKTWLACALGNKAILDGYSVFYIRLSKLFSEIVLARADGSYLSWLKKLSRYNVLIMDDFGSGPMKASDVGELLEVIEDRVSEYSNQDYILGWSEKPIGTNMMGQIPTTYLINQNYPNPFNPETKIQFGLPEASTVKLEIFNLQGQIVATLVDGPLSAGFHTATFDATTYPSGIYFYKIFAGNFSDIKRMLLVK